MLFRALETNDILKTVNIADNQFGESDADLIAQMCKTFATPDTCGSYDLRYNGIDEIGKVFGDMNGIFSHIK